VYAKCMELFPRIFKVLAEFAHHARTLFTDGMRFIALLARSRTTMAAENLFLRKQLTFYQERKVRPRRFDKVSRFMLVLLSHGFAWKDASVDVTPKTFIGWHCAGFRLFWRWKSRPGRLRIPPELRALIREMARDNPGWGEERIANELLLKLGPPSLTSYGTKVHAETPAGTTARRSTLVDLQRIFRPDCNRRVIGLLGICGCAHARCSVGCTMITSWRPHELLSLDRRWLSDRKPR